MPDLHQFFLIARREFLTRARSRFFQIGTVVLAVLMAGFIVLQSFLGGRPTTLDIGFVGDAQVMAAPLKQAAESKTLTINTHDESSVAAGQDRVRSGDLDVLVSGDPAAPNVYVQDDLDTTIELTLAGLARQVALNRALVAAGADPAQVAAQVAKANITLSYLDPNAQQRTARTVVGVFVAALLYVSLVVYGQIVAQGVVEEKQNRIVEILLSTVRPTQLLVGKVLGIGLLGIIQLLIISAVALLAVSRTQVISLPDIGAFAVFSGILWFVLGFVFYALVYAAGGSLVSRQEDLQAVLTPITIVVVGTYLAFFWVIANPDNPIGILLSMLPALSPVLMPARMATGQAEAWQVVVAVILSVAATYGMTRLAARIYTNSVLKVGSRVGWMEALAAAQSPRARAAAAPVSPGPRP
jgi:ABC-2 type transport system permease protein